MFKLALICGGPSKERGISLNSSRSVLDHLGQDGSIDIKVFFIDQCMKPYLITNIFLYSNTPSDFDFKLEKMSLPLSYDEFVELLSDADLVFPLIHGKYGEDGELQAFLERYDIPFAGSGSESCKHMYNKYNVSVDLLAKNGFHTIPKLLFRNAMEVNMDKIRDFFEVHDFEGAIVKPAEGGSSIGVTHVTSEGDAFAAICRLLHNNMGPAILEPFCRGSEFTVMVLIGSNNHPVALLPTQIEVEGIFNYRKKYLPTTDVFYNCPPKFSDRLVKEIQHSAEKLFKLLNANDFLRIDGWVLDDEKILFSDFNPISGMEQNSFIFQQASRIGMTHSQLLRYILSNACKRYGKALPDPVTSQNDKKTVYVILGGSTSERQVSLMSGTNVWLKLRQSDLFSPEPFFLDKNMDIWHLPYYITLNHTVEEIFEHCHNAGSYVERMERLSTDVRERLCLSNRLNIHSQLMPKKMSLKKFISNAKIEDAYVFLGLHGGIGENGTLQKMLDCAGIRYNGSGPEASKLCMDKYMTGKVISSLKDPNILSAKKIQFSPKDFCSYEKKDFKQYWQSVTSTLNTISLVMKPQGDGCSSGVVRIFGCEDFAKYIGILLKGSGMIPPGTLTNQVETVELPADVDQPFLIEEFIETDYIRVSENKLHYNKKSGWIELTVGVLESNGIYHALNPSITVQESEILSLEEKFQGGTGINITPPPLSVVSEKIISSTKKIIEKVAQELGIQNYARIDIFLNVESGKVIVIEANTLPGLTASTVFFQQALAEEIPLAPRQLIEMIISSKEQYRKESDVI